VPRLRIDPLRLRIAFAFHDGLVVVDRLQLERLVLAEAGAIIEPDSM
jgi:hypothetical protein